MSLVYSCEVIVLVFKKCFQITEPSALPTHPLMIDWFLHYIFNVSSILKYFKWLKSGFQGLNHLILKSFPNQKRLCIGMEGVFHISDLMQNLPIARWCYRYSSITVFIFPSLPFSFSVKLIPVPLICETFSWLDLQPTLFKFQTHSESRGVGCLMALTLPDD